MPPTDSHGNTFVAAPVRRRLWIAASACCLVALATITFLTRQYLRTPVRIFVNASDTLIVNNLKPIRIPVRAANARGRVVAVMNAQFQRMSGDSLPLTEGGKVTCTRVSNTIVRISVQALFRDVTVRCQPVKRLYMTTTPMQLIVGDSSQLIPVVAIGLNDKPVEMLAGTVRTMRDSIVDIERGLRLRAHAAGGSLTTVYVGDLHANVGVHTYDRVPNIDDLRSKRRPVMIPLQLAGGEVKRFPLPPGLWMLTMLPYEDELRGLRLRVEGANCLKAQLTPRRINCETIRPAFLVISNPSTNSASFIRGEILIDPGFVQRPSDTTDRKTIP